MTQTEVSQDTSASLDDLIEEAGSESADGTSVSEETSSAEAESPVIDVDEYGNHMVPIEIDGERVMKPLSEVRSGFMMQSDYTRKTQELAEQGKQVEAAARLQQHLAENPERTLQVLAKSYDINLGATEPDQSGELDEELDPEEARIQRIEGILAQNERQQLIDSVNSELAGLESQYGEFDRNELLSFAVQNQMEKAPLESVFWAWKKGDVQPPPSGDTTTTGETTDKANLPPVASGSSVQGGSVEAGGKPINDIDDAFEEAVRELDAFS